MMNWSILRRKNTRVYNEPIGMKERRHGCLPKVFRWHGHCYRVHAIERCWTVLKQWHRDQGRYYFLVRCAEGTFEIYQELPTNIWYLSKAQWRRKENLL